MSFIFASFPERIPGQGAAIGTILEGMGPLGVGAGQFLRSTGRLSKELNNELDDFFDGAMKPSRPGIYNSFEQTFGKDLGPIKSVGENVGSGKLNFAVHAETEDESVVMRFLRSTAQGQVLNENNNWKATTEKLMKRENPDSRKLGLLLEEAREAAMETLGKNGIEFDLSLERAAYPAAAKAYDAPADPKTGYSIEALKVNQKIQDLIPEDQQKIVSAYERIENTKLRALTPEEQKLLSPQIVSAELKAMFGKGSFDPDGHPGNWLIDTKNKRLVRIDYAQLRSVPKAEMKNIKSVMNSFLLPKLGGGDLKVIHKNIETMFDFPKHIQPPPKVLTKMIKDIVNQRDFPSFYEPQQRILALRKGLEAKLEARTGDITRIPLKSNPRAVVGSLGRLLYYRDFIPEKEFGGLLAKHMDAPVKRIWAQTKLMQVKSAVALQAGEPRSKTLQRVMQKLGVGSFCGTGNR
jgi:hypothetical protein